MHTYTRNREKRERDNGRSQYKPMIQYRDKKRNIKICRKEKKMRKPPPDWAIPVCNKMKAYGILNKDIAHKLGWSEQWISNVLTGTRTGESLRPAICSCVDEMVNERQKAG